METKYVTINGKMHCAVLPISRLASLAATLRVFWLIVQPPCQNSETIEESVIVKDEFFYSFVTYEIKSPTFTS